MLRTAGCRVVEPRPTAGGSIMRVRLLTESCTKGWLSWGPGELWLTDDALVRVGRTELAVRAVGAGYLGHALAAATRPVAGTR